MYYIEMIVNVTVTSFDREIFDGRVSPACWGLKIVLDCMEKSLGLNVNFWSNFFATSLSKDILHFE